MMRAGVVNLPVSAVAGCAAVVLVLIGLHAATRAMVFEDLSYEHPRSDVAVTVERPYLPLIVDESKFSQRTAEEAPALDRYPIEQPDRWDLIAVEVIAGDVRAFVRDRLDDSTRTIHMNDEVVGYRVLIIEREGVLLRHRDDEAVIDLRLKERLS